MTQSPRTSGAPSDETDVSCEARRVRAGGLYQFVVSEKTEVRIACGDVDCIDAFELPIIDRLLADGLLDEGEALRLRVGIQEAVVNGIEHGCLELSSAWKEEILPDGGDKFSAMRRERLLDPAFAQKTVTVWSSFNGATLEITVRDEGKGFLLGGAMRTGEKSECSVSCSGRGLALMANAADEVRFSRNGTEVLMVKKIRVPGATNGA